MEPETKPSLSARISSWLRRLREILASFWMLVVSMYSKLHAPIQKGWNAIRPQDSTDNEGANSQDKKSYTVISKPDSPLTPPNKKKSRKRSCNGLQIATFVVEMLALFGLGIYAYLTYLMYCETKKAADAAHDSAVAAKSAADTADATLKSSEKSFIIDQRPYIVVDENYPQFYQHGPIPEQKIEVNVQLKNLGKTPAIKVVTEAKLFTFRGKLIANLTQKERRKAAEQYISMLESNFLEIKTKDERARLEIAELESRNISPGQDVAPQKTYFTTSQENITLSKEELPLLKTGEITLYIIGTVSYTDFYGTRIYRTEFCSQYFGDNPLIWHICDSHNLYR